METLPGKSACAFILAGGRSSRMGADKALLEISGQTMLESTMQCAHSVTEAVTIVGSHSKFSGYGPVVEDIFPDCGPLGGIHAALRHSEADLNLVLAVDLPGLTPKFLQFLLRSAVENPVEQAVVAEFEGRWHPLCAVYRREFADAAENALKQRRFRIDALFAVVPTRRITQSELESAGFGANIFRNVNTMREFESESAKAFPGLRGPS